MVWLFLVLACAAALWWFRRGAPARADRVPGMALGLVALVAAWQWEAGSPFAADVSPDRPLQRSEAGYAGSGSCRACHSGEHGSWHGSFHRTMTQVATRDALVPRFDRLELDWFGQPVVLEWRGDRLWTHFRRGGKDPAPVERPVVQLTGSHHLQVLWYSTGSGRELAPVPMCFKVAEGIWLPLTAVFVLPPEFRDPPEPGAWNHSCTMCHTTDARPRVDVGRCDTEVGEFGIACEACHGPAEAHVRANQNPLRRYVRRLIGGDDTVVNPARLAPARSAEVCGQCHSVSILRREHFDSWREEGSPFLPGRELDATHLVIDPARDREAPELRRELARNPHFFRSSFWADGQVRLSGREFSGMRRSPCYAHADRARQLDCSSCHALHTPDGDAPGDWCDDQLRPDARGNGACTQCHAAFAEPVALAAHTRHAPESIGSSCYECHMGFTSIGLMKASRSHEITSPDVARELATGRPNACNQCHLDRTLQWTAEQLQVGFGIAAPALDDEQRTVAAGVRWILTGDAGQRLLAAWSFGQAAARAAAGDDWLAPYLARLLDDPYYVVRFAAARSLRSLGVYDNALARYDFLAEAAQARAFGENVTALWRTRYRGEARAALLLDAAGLRGEPFDRLYARRDDRPIYLAE